MITSDLSHPKCLINDYTRIYLELPQNPISEFQVTSVNVSLSLSIFIDFMFFHPMVTFNL